MYTDLLDYIPYSSTRIKPNIDDICNQVIKNTGLSYFGENNLWKTSLQYYLDDLYDNSLRSRSISRYTAKSEAIKHLTKRVKLLDYFTKHPEIENIKTPQEYFIVGMPRTGSTILHQLLSQDKRCKTIKFWEWNNPIPPESGGIDNRIKDAENIITMIKKIAPILKRIHLTEANQADECYQGWIDFLFAVNVAVNITPGFNKSMTLFWNTDLTEMYKNQKRIHQLLLNQDNNEYEWMVLKSPLHTMSLLDLNSVFKDCTFIWTHRDLKSVLGSFSAIHLLGEKKDNHGYARLDITAKRALDTLVAMMNKGLEARKILESKGVKFIDFYFSDFINDPFKAIENLYNEMGFEYNNNIKKEMKQFYQQSLENRKKNKPFRFTLEELGLNGEYVDSLFKDYYEQFPHVKH